MHSSAGQYFICSLRLACSQILFQMSLQQATSMPPDLHLSEGCHWSPARPGIPLQQLHHDDLPDRAQNAAEIHWTHSEVLCITCAAHADPKAPSAGIAEHSDEHGRLLAVKEPPLELLRTLAASAGSHMSHQTGQELPQVYHLAPHEQQQYELLRGGGPPPGRRNIKTSQGVQGSCSPADSGNALCSEELSPCHIMMYFRVRQAP